MSVYQISFIYFVACALTLAVGVTDRQKFISAQLLNIPSIKSRLNSHKQSCICIPLIKCPHLYSLLLNKRLSPDTVEFLTNQTCGFEGLEPLVCCLDLDIDPYSSSSTEPHPRSERCTFSSEENGSFEPNENEIRPKYFGHHSPYYYPKHFPTRGDFHRQVHHPYPPQPELPNSYEYPDATPEELVTTTTESPTVRSRLLPDKTCGISLDHRIVGGKNAKLGAYPWIARLGYTRPRSPYYLYRCGGTLINSRFVLTAAHCIQGLPSGLTLATVRLGEQDERTDPDCEENVCAEPPQDFTPILVIAHRNYNTPRYKNDIGLIRLDREAKISPYVSTICLPFKFMDSTNYTGQEVVAAGWGTIDVETSVSSPVLQDVTLNVTTLEKCRSIYSSRFQLNVDETQFCTLGGGKDTCEGDSGGPLMRFEQIEENGVPRYYLLGIVSFGPRRCGSTDLPAVFTKVSTYLDWILLNIDDNFL